MSRIPARFASNAAKGRATFVTFITAGDPDPTTSLAILKALPAAGADVIELGMPFSDPMADGPAIQWSSMRALKNGMSLKGTLAMVREFRAGNSETPIVLMGYYNPIYVYGVETFLVDAKEAGVDGLIVVDLPPEEDAELCIPAMKAGLNFILCVLRLDHRHHRHGDAGFLEGCGRCRAHQAAHEPARRGGFWREGAGACECHRARGRWRGGGLGSGRGDPHLARCRGQCHGKDRFGRHGSGLEPVAGRAGRGEAGGGIRDIP